MNGLLNLGSLTFGLLAWTLPIIALRRIGNKSLVYVGISFTLMSIAILFQLVFQETFANGEDLGAIMDTIGASIQLSWVLLIVTVLFNAIVIYRYIRNIQGKFDVFLKLSLWTFLLALVPFLWWVLSYMLIEPITWQTVLFGLLFLLLTGLTSFRYRKTIMISLFILLVLSVNVYIIGLKESISGNFYQRVAFMFAGYYLILNLVNLRKARNPEIKI